MWLTSLFVRRPTLVFVLLALIAVAGSIAWSTLVRQYSPNVSQPTVTVSVNYNGASPTVMRDYYRALKAGFPPGMLTSDGGITGNPADFIIDGEGRIAFAHYGRHYADSLDARQVAEIRRGAALQFGALPQTQHI